MYEKEKNSHRRKTQRNSQRRTEGSCLIRGGITVPEKASQKTWRSKCERRHKVEEGVQKKLPPRRGKKVGTFGKNTNSAGGKKKANMTSPKKAWLF